MSDRSSTTTPNRGLFIAAAVFVTLAALAAIVAAVWLFVVPVPGEPVSTPEPSEQSAALDPTERADSGIVWESEMVAEALRDASGEWTTHITSVEPTTALRRPVILVTTDIGAEQADLSDELSAGLASFAAGLTADDGTPYTFSIQILSAEGEIVGSVSDTDERWMLETSEVPTDAASLSAWLDATFGARSPAAEPWAGRVLSVLDPATDPDGFVVIRTDLDPTVAADLRAAQMIIDATNASGATFASGVRVVFGDSAYEWSALLDGIDPYYQP